MPLFTLHTLKINVPYNNTECLCVALLVSPTGTQDAKNSVIHVQIHSDQCALFYRHPIVQDRHQIALSSYWMRM